MWTRQNIDGQYAWDKRRIFPQDTQKARPSRPQEVTKDNPSKLARYILSRGGLAWSPTAHVERPLFHRGGSVRTGTNQATPPPS